MKIKILVSMAGADHSWSAGDVVSRPQREANRLIAAGFAVAVEQSPPPKARRPTEKAVKDVAETRGAPPAATPPVAPPDAAS